MLLQRALTTRLSFLVSISDTILISGHLMSCSFLDAIHIDHDRLQFIGIDHLAWGE